MLASAGRRPPSGILPWIRPPAIPPVNIWQETELSHPGLVHQVGWRFGEVRGVERAHACDRRMDRDAGSPPRHAIDAPTGAV
jgi:hypothetical protein